jgi:hypothetical protein
MYQGILIKESISDETILDFVEIEHVEIWKTEDIPKYWTVIFFVSKQEDFPEKLSGVLTGIWYVDMNLDETKILVFKDKVMKYTIGDQAGKDQVLDYCRQLGIKESQLDWAD